MDHPKKHPRILPKFSRRQVSYAAHFKNSKLTMEHSVYTLHNEFREGVRMWIVYMLEREREREREKERERERESARARERERASERKREKESERANDRAREK